MRIGDSQIAIAGCLNEFWELFSDVLGDKAESKFWTPLVDNIRSPMYRLPSILMTLKLKDATE
jgi:hypothetical protein